MGISWSTKVMPRFISITLIIIRDSGGLYLVILHCMVNCTIYKNRRNFTRCQHPSVLTDSRQCDSQLPRENSNSIETISNGRILFRFAMITNITCVEFCSLSLALFGNEQFIIMSWPHIILARKTH